MDEADSPDWNAVRAAYESGKGSVEGLCKKFQITKTVLYRRRARESWRLRFSSSRSTASQKRDRRPVLVARFFEALERQMHDIERSLASETTTGETSASGRERDARTLSSLVRTMEKLFELDTGADPAAEARKDAAHRDIEGLRQALTDRIARLGRERKD